MPEGEVWKGGRPAEARAELNNAAVPAHLSSSDFPHAVRPFQFRPPAAQRVWAENVGWQAVL